MGRRLSRQLPGLLPATLGPRLVRVFWFRVGRRALGGPCFRGGASGRGARSPGLCGARRLQTRRRWRRHGRQRPGSGNMSGEWRCRRCHPPGGAAAAARSGPCVPTPCGLPRGCSQAPEPWPWVFYTALTFPGLALLSLRPFIDSQLQEQSLLLSPSQALPAR